MLYLPILNSFGIECTLKLRIKEFIRDIMRVAICQLDIIWGEKERNFEKVARFSQEAKAGGADLLVLPETFATGFTKESDTFGEWRKDSITLKFLKKTAKKNEIGILGTFIEKTKDGNKNAAYFVSKNGKIIGKYHKINLFSFSGEEKHCAPGKKIVISEFEGIQCGITVCFDLRFPELYRTLAKRGAEAIFVVSNWPESRREHWLALLKARAIENQCYIIGVNRTGTGGELIYSGDSRVFGPFGEDISVAGKEEGVIFAEMKKEVVDEVRQKYRFLPMGWNLQVVHQVNR